MFNIETFMPYLTQGKNLISSFLEELPKKPLVKTPHLGFYPFIVVVSLRFLFPFLLSPLHYVYNDPGRHWNNGVNLFSPRIWGSIDPVFYQVYIFLLDLIAQDNGFIINFFTGLLCASVPLLWYKATREFMPRNYAYSVAIVIGIWPSMLFIYAFFMNETLLLAMIGLGVWMAFRAYRKQTIESFAVAVLCLTLMAMTRFIGVPIAIIFIGVLILIHEDKVKRLTMAAVIITALSVPAGLRTYSYLNVFAPFGFTMPNAIYRKSNKQFFNFRLTNKRVWSGRFKSPSFANAEPFYPFFSIGVPRSTQTKEWKIDTRKGREDWDKVYNSTKQRPKKIYADLTHNLTYFFFGPTWPDTVSHLRQYFSQEWLLQFHHHSRWVWLPLILTVILTLPWYNGTKQQRFMIFITLLLILGMLLQQTGIMSGRFRKPLEPFMIISFVLVIQQLMQYATMHSRQIQLNFYKNKRIKKKKT